MLLIALAALLVMGIVYFQVVQGLYSALIMAILTVLCAALAFNFYEPLATAVLYENQPAYADAISLVALFIIPLLVLRIITDKILPSNVVLGVWADRIGGGLLGLITAEIMVGVLLIAVCMLPLGETILTYTSHDASLKTDQQFMPFYPVQFTLGTIDLLSRTGLAGGKSFASNHDDLNLESFCARNTAGTMGRVDALADAIRAMKVFAPSDTSKYLPPGNSLPDNPLLDRSVVTKTIIIRVTVETEAQGEEKNGKWWRLPATHFRLVATDKNDKTITRSYYPVGYLTAWKIEQTRRSIYRNEPPKIADDWHCTGAKEKDGVAQLAYLTVERKRWPRSREARETQKTTGTTIDWVYKIPIDDKPQELVFRRTVRQPIRKVVDGWPQKEGALARVVPRDTSSRRHRR